jgi:hypothetical protein
VVTLHKEPEAIRSGRPTRLVLAAGLAVVVAVAVYAVGRSVTPHYSMGLFGRSGITGIRLKALLATGILGLAVAQLGSALWMYRRLPGAGAAPRWLPVLHRLGGAAAVLLSLPVAVHCVLTYGVELSSPRVAAHSLAGCFFYGAFAAKLLIVRSRRLPGWALPVAGGVLVTLIVVLWYSAALWYFAGFRLP